MNLRKMFIFALIIGLIGTLCLPAHAAQAECTHDISAFEYNQGISEDNSTIEGAEVQSTHTCKWSSTPIITYVAGKAIDATSSGCRKYCKDTYPCTVSGCNATYVRYRYATSSTAHTKTVYDATCNGTVQTLYNWCYYCHYKLSNTQQTCPGGPHTGGCSYLPA